MKTDDDRGSDMRCLTLEINGVTRLAGARPVD